MIPKATHENADARSSEHDGDLKASSKCLPNRNDGVRVCVRCSLNSAQMGFSLFVP